MTEIAQSITAERTRMSNWRQKATWMRLVRFGASWVQKLQVRPARRLRISETLSLGEKRQLLLVECGDRQFLIGAAGNFLATLAELRPPADTKENGDAGHE